METVLNVAIREPQKTLFEGKAKSLSSMNEKGPFDILPSHSQFVATVDEYIKIVLPDGTEERLEIEEGVLRVKGNEVEVYL